jgi:hypothetical protein
MKCNGRNFISPGTIFRDFNFTMKPLQSLSVPYIRLITAEVSDEARQRRLVNMTGF